ncbi:hypothetical protein [Kordiimonas sp.]|uniref:hypothetical protein n=1 Tax=Kordiimonas sp. TaxID=1970157 RepID=UPI003A9487AF
MDRSLQVAVLKDGETFLHGTFDVSDEDYDTVIKLLDEVEMDHGQAASLISGYMHARDVGQVTEDMGKIAMFAVVYMLQAGETNIEIPFEG